MATTATADDEQSTDIPQTIEDAANNLVSELERIYDNNENLSVQEITEISRNFRVVLEAEGRGVVASYQHSSNAVSDVGAELDDALAHKSGTISFYIMEDA